MLKTFLRRLLPHNIWAYPIVKGPLRGKRIVTSLYDYPAAILGYTEQPLLAWFAQHVQPGETWLDIGAHYGYTALALCGLVGKAGRVFAFEPMLSTAGYLTETRSRNHLAQLVVVPMGLGQTETLTTARLPIVRGMVDSTLKGIIKSQKSKASKTATWEETLMVARLDWLWQQICGDDTRIHGVKIDVQGMELAVLRGMTELLTQHHPRLVVEVHAGVSRADLLGLMAQVGYARQATPIEPVPGETTPQYVDNHSYAFTWQ
jgi:FkbM family methyltransferase